MLVVGMADALLPAKAEIGAADASCSSRSFFARRRARQDCATRGMADADG